MPGAHPNCSPEERRARNNDASMREMLGGWVESLNRNGSREDIAYLREAIRGGVNFFEPACSRGKFEHK